MSFFPPLFFEKLSDSCRGKVFVYTGILPIAQDHDGLAVILAHEIAHVVAHHSAERMSSWWTVMAGIAAFAGLFDVSGQVPSLFMNVLYMLPNSRTMEVCLELRHDADAFLITG